MSAPDTSPEAIERNIKKRRSQIGVKPLNDETDALLRALSSQLQEAEAANRLWSAVGANKDRQLQEAHRHLGTALGAIRLHDFREAPEPKFAGYCIQCGQRREQHEQIDAAWAYYRAHGGQG